MAIDTAAKRRSAAGIPALPLGPGVTPDASPGQAWRQSAGWGYVGILAGEPVVFVPATYTATVYVNITPTISTRVNPSPTVEVYSG